MYGGGGLSSKLPTMGFTLSATPSWLGQWGPKTLYKTTADPKTFNVIESFLLQHNFEASSSSLKFHY